MLKQALRFLEVHLPALRKLISLQVRIKLRAKRICLRLLWGLVEFKGDDVDFDGRID